MEKKNYKDEVFSKGIVYGYARVSTKGQARDGNSLKAQTEELTKAGCEIIFTESYTGTKKSRPELDKLLRTVHKGDTLVVTKLDRIARSIQFGAELIEELANKGVTVNVLNLGILDNTPSGKLMRNVFLAFAEFERDMIVERTAEGRAIARETNPDYREGRKRIFVDEITLENTILLYLNGKLKGSEAAEKAGLNYRTFMSRVKEYTTGKKIGQLAKYPMIK